MGKLGQPVASEALTLYDDGAATSDLHARVITNSLTMCGTGQRVLQQILRFR